MATSNSSGSNGHQNDGHSTSNNDVHQGDEIQTNTTSKGHNGQQQTNYQPDHSQEQNLSDTIETTRLKAENKYLKLILDNLHKSIIVGEAMQPMQLEPPKDINNDKSLIELTTKALKIHEKLCDLKTDESEKKTISKAKNVQQQESAQPDLPHEQQSLSGSIIAMTNDEERKMKLLTELDTLRGKVTNLEKENKRLKTLEVEKKKLQDELSDKEIAIIQLREKPNRRPERPRSAYPVEQRVNRQSREEMQMKIDEQLSLIDRLTNLKAHTKEECERHCNEMDALKGKLKHCEQLLNSLKEEKRSDEKTIIGLREEKEELLIRLSKIASDRLTHENTDITDLSDDSRPSKLAEKMSELYDNQWTSAFDELKTNEVVDENAVDMLLKILMETNQVCKELTQSHYQTIKHACTCFEYSSSADAENKGKGKIITKGNISIEMQQDIKRIWRESSKKVLKKVNRIIKKKVSEKFEFPLLQMTQTLVYMGECVDLCWMMNLQEKPLHLDISVVEKDGHPWFDTEKFRSYTKTGQHLAFVVWPALYLFDGGSLLKKGVAQGLKAQKSASGQEYSNLPRS